MSPTLTPAQLNRATLDRQLLLERRPIDPLEGVKRVVAVQAQSPPSLYISMWSRLAEVDPESIDAALNNADLIRATLMRITLHAVHVDDYTGLHSAMQPTLRGARLNDRRYTDTGLRASDADALIPELLDFLATPHSNAEIEAWLAERVGESARWAWWALRHYAPVRHNPIGGPWSFGERPAYVATTPKASPYDVERSDRALEALVEKYLQGFGPASIADISQFGLVHRGRVRPAIERLGDRLTRLTGPGGAELFDVAGSIVPEAETRAPPRLLPMWDSILLAYHDRTRIIPEHLRKLVIRSNGDVLPTVLVNGRVAGVWRTADDRDDLAVEVTAFEEFDQSIWEELQAEASSLIAFIAERDPTPYQRYRRWWSNLVEPATEIRLLSA